MAKVEINIKEAIREMIIDIESLVDEYASDIEKAQELTDEEKKELRNECRKILNDGLKD